MRAIALVLIASPVLAAPPAPLVCVQRFYLARPVLKEGAWYVVLPDKQRYLYTFSDQAQKPLEHRLRFPDVRDMFSLRYPRGPIQPITTTDDDPGRIRHYPIFDATYPIKELKRARFFGHDIKLQKRVVPALERVQKRLEKAAAKDPSLALFWKKLGGAYEDRPVAGTPLPSAHSYGIAIDLNPEQSSFWRRQPQWQNKIPQAIVDAFEAEGFIWGGRWFHFDTAHFEYRPELLDPKCYE
jgi:hypothetical protein